MYNQFSRTKLLIGDEGLNRLKNAKIAVFGIGGVGSFVVEALARAGVGKIVLVDHDKVSITNLNRQLIALHSTIGKYKVDVMEERIHDINPNCEVTTFKEFVMPDSKTNIITEGIDYVIDCVDTVTAKIFIITTCKTLGIPIISSMGTGNKLDATKFEITDIYKTSVCPLAKVMRKELKKRRINKLKVLYSKADSSNVIDTSDKNSGRHAPGSISYVPSTAGLLIAGEVIKDIINK